MAGKNDDSAAIMTPPGQDAKLDGVFDVVSRIQKFSAAEKRGAVMSADFLSIKEQWDLMAIGFKKTISSGLVTAAFTPLLVGVIEKVIPCFGDAEPTFVDKILVFALTIGFPLSYASVVYHLGQYYTGEYTKAMIKQFISGVIWGAICKIIVVFVGFNAISILLMNEKNLVRFVLFLAEHLPKAPPEKLNKFYFFLVSMRGVLETSAYFVLFITVAIQICIPLASIWFQNKKTKEHAGLADFPT